MIVSFCFETNLSFLNCVYISELSLEIQLSACVKGGGGGVVLESD